MGAVVGFSFLLRLVLAGKESYWIDELFSVEQYVLHHDTVGQAIAHLAETSVHPPLYQFLLYFWVELFGSTEAATRTLSNLFVTAGIVVLHRFVERFHGRTVANVVAFAFAFSYTATFFGIETRSYALTILLAVASSYTLFRYLDALRAAKGLWRMAPSPWAGAFLTINVALLVTHYYNVFYWAAQALFAVTIILVSDRRRWQLLPGLVSAYMLQIGVFLFAWYPNATASFRTYAPQFETDTPERSPLAIIAALTERNLFLGPVPGIVAVLLVLGAVAVALVRRHPTTAGDSLDRTGMAYALAMLVLPAVIAWGAFLAIGAERFAARYYVFLVPHLIVAVVLAGRTAVRSFRALAWRIRPPASWWFATSLRKLPLGLLLLGVVVIPGTLAAAEYSKADWRGTAADVVALVESNPNERVAVYQASFRPQIMLDHYLRRHGDGQLLADGFIRNRDELQGRLGLEERGWRELTGHDALVVVFVEPPADWFPVTLERLEQRYGAPFSMLDANGHGLVVFDLAGD